MFSTTYNIKQPVSSPVLSNVLIKSKLQRPLPPGETPRAFELLKFGLFKLAFPKSKMLFPVQARLILGDQMPLPPGKMLLQIIKQL